MCDRTPKPTRRTPIEEFLVIRVRPLPAVPACPVPRMHRTATARAATAAPTTSGGATRQQPIPGWTTAGGGTGIRRGRARTGEPAALPQLVVVEVLFGLQQRAPQAASSPTCSAAAVVRRCAVEPGRLDHDRRAEHPHKGSAGTLLLTALARTPAGAGRSGDRTGQGRVGSGGVRPSRDAVVHRDHPALAAPRRPSGGRPNNCRATAAAAPPACRSKINSLGLLSETSRQPTRPGGLVPALGRPTSNRSSTGSATWTRPARSAAYRATDLPGRRAVLAGIRALGLTRPGGPAAGLAGDFALERGDIPAEPERGEPGRDLPPEIMAVLCANLDTLEPARSGSPPRSASTPDGGPRRSSRLPWTAWTATRTAPPCWSTTTSKPTGSAAGLPISQATAAVITAQQQRVRERFPDTPLAELICCPSPHAKSRRAQGDQHRPPRPRHRDWVDPLPVLRTRDGTEFDKTQDRALRLPAHLRPTPRRRRVADRRAGRAARSPHLEVTRRYYRVGEDRRRAAVDTVTALQLRPARQPDLARRPRPAGLRARPPRRRRRRRPLRPLHRTVQRPSRRRGLPGPVPLRGLRPLPHRRRLPARACRPTSMTCCAPANGSPPPSTGSTSGPAPTPPPPRRRSPGSGG